MINTENIRKYLDGELSPPEMQAIEKMALEDPFLADAIEGYAESRNQAEVFETGLADLHERLARQIKHKERKKIIPWLSKHWQAAAAVFLIMTLAVVGIRMLNKTTEPPTIAVSQKSPARADSSTGIQKSDRSKAVEPESDLPLTQNKKKTSLPEKNRLPDAPEASVKSTSSSASVERENEIEDKKIPDSNTFQKDLAAAAPVTEYDIGRAAGSEMTASRKRAAANYVQGLVLDEQNHPVAGASVSLAKEKTATLTDSKGYFKLYIKRQDSSHNLLIHSVGYRTASAFWRNDTAHLNLYRLQPVSTALNEVVQQGYDSRKPADEEGQIAEDDPAAVAKAKSVKNRNAAPLMGWESFNKYVEENKKMPAADSLQTGIERVSFFVDQQGVLSLFKIEQSVSPAHDEQITKLIQSVPWKILKGKKQQVVVSVEYK